MKIIHNFQSWVQSAFGYQTEKPKIQLLQQYNLQTSTLRRGRRITLVKRTPLSYWEEHGWKHDGQTYQGKFQTRFGSWSGYVTNSPSGRVEVFIHNPPAALQRHQHWQCFNKRNDDWFFVHPVTPIADVSAAIINVEKTITEAYEN